MHRVRQKTSPCHFLTHSSLHCSAQPTWAMSQGVAACSMQPGKPGQGGCAARALALGWRLSLMCLQCLLPFWSLPPWICFPVTASAGITSATSQVASADAQGMQPIPVGMPLHGSFQLWVQLLPRTSLHGPCRLYFSYRPCYVLQLTQI